MVVNGLQEFMSRKENISMLRKKIDILAEIDHWKSAKKSRPKILIDIKEFIHVAVQNDDIGQLMGGRYSLNLLYFNNFFQSLNNARAELVFFVAEKTLSDEAAIFIPDREKEYIKYIQILDEIDASAGDIGAYVAQRQSDIKAPMAMELNLQKLVRNFGKMQTNHFRHNQEIAQYAKQHDDSILAIITNDTDFMIFDGNFQYWRANDITMKDLTVFGYCREKLRKLLELNTQQLELLSALSGSIYLPCDVLTDFYFQIGIHSTTYGKHIAPLAYYISNKMQTESVTSNIEKIACDVFGKNYTSPDINAITNGLVQYNLNFEKPVTKALEFCKERNAFVYKLLTDEVYLIKDISYIDYRKYKSKNYAELVVPLVRKLHGILYANERPRPKTRTICMKYAHDEPYKVVDEPINYPPMILPEWFALVFKNRDDYYDSVRWSLLDWMFNFGQKFTKSLQNLHTRCLSIVIITLKYLLQHGEITIDEADAILVTENNTRIKYKRTRHPRIDFPDKLNTHFIRIAHLYTKVYTFVRYCVETCGLFYYTSQDYIMFDGRYCYQILDNFTRHPDEKEGLLRCVQDDRIYID